MFENALHPYTRALLSAIPFADPELEKSRHADVYDYDRNDIDYSKGHYHKVKKDHSILCTDDEFEKWSKRNEANLA